MAHCLSDRRISWSKNTNYVSVASQRPPMEVGSHAHAPNKSVEQQLENNKQIISQMHRKSLAMMAGQRKLLEKSMLAYSEKMKDINDKKTTDLFREIQSRNGASSKSLPDIHMPHITDTDMPLDSPKAKTRHKHNSEEKVDASSVASGNIKRSSIASENKHPDFNHLRSLLRRSSSADLISAISLPQGLKYNPKTRFDSTQSLIDTAGFLEEYRQKAQSQFKHKKKSKARLSNDTEVKHSNCDSAYSSEFDSNDEMSELDTVSHFEDKSVRNAPLRKGYDKKLFLSKKGRSVSKGKPKLIRKGKKLLKKMNSENSTHTNDLHEKAIMSSLHKLDDNSLG